MTVPDFGAVGLHIAEEFRVLQETIIDCRKCPRLVAWRERVAREKVRRYQDEEYWGRPIPAYGDPHAAVLLVGLAPAAHGGNRTGRMFTGDRSADWLYEALHRFGYASQPSSLHRGDGLHLNDCLITAAARCAPPENKPAREELDNCRAYLRQEIGLLTSLRVVIALGRIGFEAFLKAWQENGHPLPEPKPAFRHGGEWELRGGPTLIASYHPSQQNTLTGKLTRPMFHRIFRRVRQIQEKQTPICSQ